LSRSSVRRASLSPHYLIVVPKNKYMSCMIYSCACDRFILFLITLWWTAAVPHCRPPFTPFSSVHFTHLNNPRHKWLSHFTPQTNAVIPFRCSGCILLQILLTQQPVCVIPFPNPLFPFIQSPPMSLSHAFPMVYFLRLRLVYYN
jgi:hypothetical protein